MTLDQFQSPAIAIRDAARERLRAASAFTANPLAITKWRKSPLRQIQPADLPVGSVYFLSEGANADGDENAGVPEFKNEVTLGISVAVAISDDDERQDALDAAFTIVMSTLLNDGTFVVLVEGTPRYDRQHAEGLAGANGETPYSEMRLRITFTFRTVWSPVATTPLEQVNVTTQPGADANADEITAQFTIES
jgi:hypothetical protein